MRPNSYKIPLCFSLLGRTINVEMCDDLADEFNGVGVAQYGRQLIKLQRNTKGCPRTLEQIVETFFHELVHHILNAMNKKELKNDEDFVEMFAALLHQALTTAEYAPGDDDSLGL